MDEFILTLFQTGYKLRASTLFHLLNGKRTSSVLINGFFYENLPYLGLFSEWHKTHFDRVIARLTEKNFLEEVDPGFYQLTTLGKAQLADNQIYQFEYLDNFRYGKHDLESWQLIKLAVQVLSELSCKNPYYLPIETRPLYLQSIKRWLKTAPRTLTDQVFTELTEVFEKMPQKDSDFLANQFSGHEITGKVWFQLLPAQTEQKLSNVLYQKNCLHQFIYRLPPGELFRLIEPRLVQNMNQSMLATKKLFLENYSLTEIQNLRNIKNGTVTDHLIEWALLTDDFPFEALLSAAKKAEFEKRNLREIRDWQYNEVAEMASFLEFRLFQIAYLKGRFSC